MLRTLDGFLAERKVGPVDLMKIDVETYEPQVLRGGARMLREDRPVIFLEILPATDADALETIRREFDYLDGVLLVVTTTCSVRARSATGSSSASNWPAIR
jgi:hypothetical protein